jgi:hypothetical protein
MALVTHRGEGSTANGPTILTGCAVGLSGGGAPRIRARMVMTKVGLAGSFVVTVADFAISPL